MVAAGLIRRTYAYALVDRRSNRGGREALLTIAGVNRNDRNVRVRVCPMRLCRLIVVLLAAVMLVSCAHNPPVRELAFNAEEPYRLDSGDRLRIAVFGQDGLTSTYAVDTAGRINMSLIGAVKARGLTSAQ